MIKIYHWTNSISYRSEIDALRALAVLAVLLFHFFPSQFKSGFLGVDLFFVISGYLITKIIYKNYIDANFSYLDFYLRRIRRILPAVLVMMLVSALVALTILIAADLERFSKSLLASLGFISNIYFWRTGGYFSTSDELKPLLHMWSLGVEEQFYVLFPALFILLLKIIKKLILCILIILLICLISYGLNFYLISIGGSNPAFFLLPTRIWQFGIGILFALIPSFRQNNSISANLFFGLGLCLIFIDFLYPISKLPNATFLCIGSGFILWNNLGNQGVIKKIISIPPIQLIGLSSFSLYLWHWPIIVFLKYIYIDHIPLEILIFAILITFVISYLSWKFIENLFRYKLSTKSVIYFVSSIYLVLTILSISIIYTKGFPNRDSQLINSIAQSVDSNYRCPPSTYRLYGASRACLIGESSVRPSYALLGNSHAQMYAPALNHYLKESKGAGLLIPLNSCLPTINVNLSIDCLEKAGVNYQAVVNDKNIKTVIIGLTWYSSDLIDRYGNRFIDGDLSARKNDLLSIIKGLEEAGKEVYLIGPIAIPNFDFPSVTSRKLKFNEKDIVLSSSRQAFNNAYGGVNLFFSEKMKNKYIAPYEIFCDYDKCYFSDNTGAYFADSNHLSSYGVSKLYPLFMKTLGVSSK